MTMKGSEWPKTLGAPRNNPTYFRASDFNMYGFAIHYLKDKG